ncbi:DUF1801 domain-containing protein [Shewanella sp. KX20019]|uniref:DUF1801 domain-containing protein n=1 Tax=Shewanella sp. KX20019 TaxID=2803864 RepID=UPI00192528AE|nr:DUF1801 domain-containing protein [Shewanella sp. KX20019]QQX82126.1 DUF1801 domain-containing protein [Shewanella sp. KX20019]
MSQPTAATLKNNTKTNQLKTQPTNADVNAFIAQKVDGQKLQDCKVLLNLLTKLTGQTATMWGTSIIGFGQYHYKYASGREGDWPLVGFSPRKNGITVYIMNGFSDYEALLAKLGKYKIGKSCLYIKSLSGIDIEVLSCIIVDSIEKMTNIYSA